MMINDDDARDIAKRWGGVAGSEPLTTFASSGLIEDRKKLLDAIDYVRLFLKHPEELDKLREYVTHPCPFEVAARDEGWAVEDNAILHIHDYDKSVRYENWKSCCDSEDIVLRDDDERPKKRRFADR